MAKELGENETVNLEPADSSDDLKRQTGGRK
jgi:hypothetical protein